VANTKRLFIGMLWIFWSCALFPQPLGKPERPWIWWLCSWSAEWRYKARWHWAG